MTREQMLELMPRFAGGTLPPAQALVIARALKQDPALVEELLFTLELREALRTFEAPVPAAMHAPAAMPLPSALSSAAQEIRGALRLAGSGARLLGKLI